MSKSKGIRVYYASDLDRFEAFVDKDGPGGCWLWTGSTNVKGYGRFWLGRSREAHRVAYELLIGEIPEGLQLDHLCRVRHCVNPEHLEPVTHEENFRRGDGIKGPAPFERCRSGKHLMSEWRRYYGKDRQAKCYGCIKERARKR